MAQAMYFGSTKEEAYSHISTYTSGSYYDAMRNKVLEMTELVLEMRIADGSRAICIGDFGTADGVNVFPLLEEVIELVEMKTKGKMQTMIYLNDQANNNFNLLHANIAEAAFKRKAKTFVTVSGQTMYEQCLPNESLDIVLSSVAIHWLSKIPCTIENGLSYMHGTEHERRMFQEQAVQDWKDFVLSRGHEMKSGGYMVVQTPTAEAHEYGRTFFLDLSKMWRRMYAEKRINKEEFHQTVMPLFLARSEDDIRCIFDDPEVIDSGLQIISIKEQKYEMKPLIRIRSTQGDVAYAEAIVDFVRPWLRHIIDQGLSNTRLSNEKDQIIEEYFGKLKKLAVENKLQFDFFNLQEIVVSKYTV